MSALVIGTLISILVAGQQMAAILISTRLPTRVFQKNLKATPSFELFVN